MNVAAIDKAFADLIAERGVYKKLGVQPGYIQQLRFKLNHPEAGGISLEAKMDLLKKSGWKEPAAKFTREDLIDLSKFIIRSGAKAKQWGPEYLVEKWQASKK